MGQPRPPASADPADSPGAAASGPSVTALLAGARGGDAQAMPALFALVYDELHRLARAQRRRWRGDETMNTTALVHEAFIKLTGGAAPRFEDRRHFFATASKAMRQVLVNYAESRQAAKRGAGAEHVPLDDEVHGAALVAEDTVGELLDLERALRALEARSPRQCRVVECRLFGGLSVDETAEALDISPATVKREWQVASALLLRDVSRPAARG
ncbi:MAG: sigma-70 family RNA polymerase sigma factor [Rubrivivax sp.]|nr:sigma-70 family RNA polymerase sigma factor [Rubrivivax sp.]MCL4697169.1 sigma-70 family RNA polymerase sigma factor [Burkholderiaceae bacterium]